MKKLITIALILLMAGVAWGDDLNYYHMHVTDLSGDESIYPLPKPIETICKAREDALKEPKEPECRWEVEAWRLSVVNEKALHTTPDINIQYQFIYKLPIEYEPISIDHTQDLIWLKRRVCE